MKTAIAILTLLVAAEARGQVTWHRIEPSMSAVQWESIEPTFSAPHARHGYPLRGRWYSHPSGSLVTHLSSGVHAGKFDVAWLRQLEPEELESLHSDDHQGIVKWQHVVRPVQAAAKPKVSSAYQGGTCRRGLFGRWICP